MAAEVDGLAGKNPVGKELLNHFAHCKATGYAYSDRHIHNNVFNHDDLAKSDSNKTLVIQKNLEKSIGIQIHWQVYEGHNKAVVHHIQHNQLEDEIHGTYMYGQGESVRCVVSKNSDASQHVQGRSSVMHQHQNRYLNQNHHRNQNILIDCGSISMANVGKE